MNILFLTISNLYDIKDRGLYQDLFREFVKKGHHVSVAAPAERRLNENTNLKEFDGYSVLRVKVGNIQKTNIIEKGISTILLEPMFKAAIKKYYSDRKFDMVIYSTPPITFAKVIDYIKKRDGATSYLLLKDIFPQNAVDLGMFSEGSIFNKYFRRKEISLYKQSDYIGCMSQANVDYILKHNPFVNKDIIHVSPNCTEIENEQKPDKKAGRTKFGIPEDAKVFLYGGNLGKPQGIPFVIECLKKNVNKPGRFFVISGMGTEYPRLKAFFDEYKPENMLLINGLPRDEYEMLANCCDIGLIFLDHRFTIPNFPSRLLAYMRNSMPVLAATDPNTDIGKTILDAKMGWWCESNDAERFAEIVDGIAGMSDSDLNLMGQKGTEYMEEHYNAAHVAEIIISYMEK